MKAVAILFVAAVQVFVLSQTLQAQEPQAVLVTVAAPVYVQPDSNRTPLRVAQVGSVLRVLGTEGDWYQVEFQDPQYGRRVGYVEKKNVRPQAAPLPPPMDLSIRDSTAQQRPSRGSDSSPAGEVSVGYTFLTSPGGQRFPLGWYADGSANLNSVFAVLGQATGNYKTVDGDVSVRVHSFMGGVHFNRHTSQVTPFAQVLFGIIRLSGSSDLAGLLPFSIGLTETLGAIQVGGGVNLMSSSNAGLRLGVDYVRAFGEDGGDIFRVSAGVVIPIGAR